MMTSSVRRFAPLATAFCVSLGLLLSAGSARAQAFTECVFPSNVPESVFFTILDQASSGFGTLPESVCHAIVKKGVATCKSQVKAAAQCFNRALAANYVIAVKQCQQLADPVDRAACKDDSQATRDGGKDEISASKADGIAVCEGEFAGALGANCEGI